MGCLSELLHQRLNDPCAKKNRSRPSSDAGEGRMINGGGIFQDLLTFACHLRCRQRRRSLRQFSSAAKQPSITQFIFE